MNRYYIFKDSTQIGSAATRKAAMDMIRQYQKRETHYLLKPEFSIIYGIEEFISYEKTHEKGAVDSTWSRT